jgi:nucleosome binding factor SPN SPT16 subunit
MDKIYLITSGCYSDYGVHGFFTDEAEADEYCEIQNRAKPCDEYKVEECADLSKTFLTMNKNPIIEHRVSVQNNGVFMRYIAHELCDAPDNRVKVTSDNIMFDFSIKYYIYVYLPNVDDDKALKIAQDMLAQYKAEQAGI